MQLLMMKQITWPLWLNRKNELWLLEGQCPIAHLPKILNLTPTTRVKLFQFFWVLVLPPDMGQNSMSKRIARSFASFPQAHMLPPEQLMTFGSGLLNSRYFIRSFAARKVFCFGTSTWTCEAFCLQRASRI